MKRLLFLCTGNSCRSQMAEAWLRHLAGDRFEALSAGTHPTPVNANAIRVMREAGVDISHHQSKSIDLFIEQHLDILVSVCDHAKEACPAFTSKVDTRLHWPFEDPAAATGREDEVFAVYRTVRDQIRGRIASYLAGE